jgi:hypothetical protein
MTQMVYHKAEFSLLCTEQHVVSRALAHHLLIQSRVDVLVCLCSLSVFRVPCLLLLEITKVFPVYACVILESAHKTVACKPRLLVLGI